MRPIRFRDCRVRTGERREDRLRDVKGAFRLPVSGASPHEDFRLHLSNGGERE
jgi:hypothetical protein